MLRMFYLVLVLTLLLFACSPAPTPVQAPAATPVPATETAIPILSTSTAVPPTVTASPASPTPTPAPVEKDDALSLRTSELPAGSVPPGVVISNFPTVNCCKGRAVPAGPYRLPAWLDMRFTLEVGDGWRVMNEEGAKLFTLARGQNSLNNPSELIVLMNVTAAGPVESLMSQFLEEPNITPLSEPTEADLAGYAGWQQDFAVLPNPDYQGSARDDIPAGVQFLRVVQQYFAPGFLWTNSSPEAQLRFIVVDVGDALLFVYLEAPPVDFATFAADANQMLQTLGMPEP